MNHIKQTIKVEIAGAFTSAVDSQELEKRVLFTGFYNFGRCVLKNG